MVSRRHCVLTAIFQFLNEAALSVFCLSSKSSTCLSSACHSLAFSGLPQASRRAIKSCYDTMLIFFHMAEVCDTLQSKQKRNYENKACLNERTILRLLN